MTEQTGDKRVLLTIVLALFSGLIGSLVSPFFQERLTNEGLRVAQIEEVSKNLQQAHMNMSLQAWRLTIASKATAQELNSIHDAWLFSYREVTKWLELINEYFPDSAFVENYRQSISEFYELENKEFGLADSVNRPKGQKLIAAFEKDYMVFRRYIYENTKVSLISI